MLVCFEGTKPFLGMYIKGKVQPLYVVEYFIIVSVKHIFTAANTFQAICAKTAYAKKLRWRVYDIHEIVLFIHSFF